MTVLTTQSRDEGVTQYDTNGKQTYFEYGFTLLPGDTIAVFLKDKRIFNFEERTKGIIIEPAPTGRLVIVRQLVIAQTRDFSAFDSFNAEWTETAMDKLILLKQEAAEYRAFMNLTAIHYTTFVKITNDKGTDADISVWTGANDEGVPAPPVIPPTDPNNPPPESYLRDLVASTHVDWQTVPDPPFNSATIELTVRPNGQITAYHEHGGEPAEYPENWNNAAPLVDNSGNFEARITWLTGWRYLYYRNNENTAWEIVATAGASGVDSSPWQNLANQNRYRMWHRDTANYSGTLLDKPCTCQLEIREVGKPETVKIKSLDLRLLIQT